MSAEMFNLENIVALGRKNVFFSNLVMLARLVSIFLKLTTKFPRIVFDDVTLNCDGVNIRE